MLALDIRQTVDDVYRAESRRIFATLVRLVNDFDLAEEAMHEAFASAIEQWPRDGVPSNPRTWLVSAGRFKAIDAIRRRSLFDASLAEIGNRLERNAASKTPRDEDDIDDDRLRLIFTCCHPALSPSTQIALTLREVCDLSTEEIASAAIHAEAETVAATDWVQIVALYELLSLANPSPVVELNRAVALAMRDGPAVGLSLIEAILERGDLADYHLIHAARADLYRQLGKTAQASESYRNALALVQQEPERRFLEKRLRELFAK